MVRCLKKYEREFQWGRSGSLTGLLSFQSVYLLGGRDLSMVAEEERIRRGLPGR
jgi:hypothetical protein